MIMTNQFRACDVCRLLDYRTDEKLTFFCGLCDAWICHECSENWPRRIRAAIKRKLEPGYKGLPNYEEIAQGGQINVTK